MLSSCKRILLISKMNIFLKMFKIDGNVCCSSGAELHGL